MQTVADWMCRLTQMRLCVDSCVPSLMWMWRSSSSSSATSGGASTRWPRCRLKTPMWQRKWPLARCTFCVTVTTRAGQLLFGVSLFFLFFGRGRELDGGEAGTLWLFGEFKKAATWKWHRLMRVQCDSLGHLHWIKLSWFNLRLWSTFNHNHNMTAWCMISCYGKWQMVMSERHNLLMVQCDSLDCLRWVKVNWFWTLAATIHFYHDHYDCMMYDQLLFGNDGQWCHIWHF